MFKKHTNLRSLDRSSQSTMKFASCDDDPGNSVNAYLWVGVQGVVAPEFIIRPNFLTSNSR
ncbi:hypothetical protein [Leptospira noguchii]|uniref:Uncharacterized protein n=2 Tax=Leptospira noguchii TaxID=28182 RepID=A0AAE9GCA6_9LEPT|nr:hypothetical protein [Leptospira noguchii]UOG31311.1 hypothetical protein MAL06_04535 [Leptospira noguchii]UOG51434.1 hypothetical protein MAL09_12060 [Leptospira noguchii]UOG57426.1 hypothetical protein MAL03_04505 [Leptospira noguchii]